MVWQRSWNSYINLARPVIAALCICGVVPAKQPTICKANKTNQGEFIYPNQRGESMDGELTMVKNSSNLPSELNGSASFKL